MLPKGEVPHTRHVRGSNYALIGVFEDRLPGRAIVICVIDNLVKVGLALSVRSRGVAAAGSALVGAGL